MEIIDLKSKPCHIHQLAEWHHQEWAHLNPGRSVEILIEQMHDYLNDASIPRMFVAEQDNQVMGSSSLIPCDMDNHPEFSPWLANVYVHSAFRNKGLGKLLVNAVVSYAHECGFKKIYLFTSDQEGFYSSQGWSTVSRENYKGDKVTIMQLDLAS